MQTYTDPNDTPETPEIDPDASEAGDPDTPAEVD